MSVKLIRGGAILALAIVCVIALISTQHSTQAAPVASVTKNVVGLPGYDVDVFAKGTSEYTHPDSVVVTEKYVYIGYQNVTAKDGTDNKTSTIVEYTAHGDFVKKFSAPGHNDGLRYDDKTSLLWVTSNEDGNPRIVTIDPKTGVVTPYQFPMPTPHGGGYDDVFILNGTAYIAASNPLASPNTAPAIDKIELKAGQVILTPVLLGNANATNTITKQTAPLNLIDPDSLSTDNQGDLVLNDQADSQFVTLHNPGTTQQTVTVTPVGTQTDDIVWVPSKEGRLLVVDGANNVTYKVSVNRTDFTKGAVYTEAPSDSGVAGFVGTVDLTTGTITPVIIGMGSPTGLAFQPGLEN